MLRAGSLRQKEVINVNNGNRLGFVSDVEIDFSNGYIESVIVPGKSRFLWIFGKKEEFVIAWKDIVKIGEDILLVDYDK